MNLKRLFRSSPRNTLEGWDAATTHRKPHSQLDRFLMKILVRYPSREELNRIVERTIQTTEEQVNPVMDRDAILQVKSVCREVLVAPHVQEFAIQLVMA